MNDRIQKEVLIRAPRARVWRALVDRSEFGAWFLAALPPGSFQPGEHVSGQSTYPGYEHLTMDVDVVDVVPEKSLSFRWHPGAEPDVTQPQTLVEFTLEEVEGGTLLRVVESGFDQLTLEHRERVYRDNEGGWEEQMRNVERHVLASS